MTLRFGSHGWVHVRPHGERIIRYGDLLFVNLLYECGLEQMTGTYTGSIAQFGLGVLRQGHPSPVEGTVATKRSNGLQGIYGTLIYF